MFDSLYEYRVKGMAAATGWFAIFEPDKEARRKKYKATLEPLRFWAVSNNQLGQFNFGVLTCCFAKKGHEIINNDKFFGYVYLPNMDKIAAEKYFNEHYNPQDFIDETR